MGIAVVCSVYFLIIELKQCATAKSWWNDYANMYNVIDIVPNVLLLVNVWLANWPHRLELFPFTDGVTENFHIGTFWRL